MARAQGNSIGQLVDTWNRFVDNTVAALDSRQMPLFSMWDVLTHEGDLRETHRLERLDGSVVDEALTPLWSMFAKRYPGPGRLDVDVVERTLTMGDGEPVLALRTTPYELYRGMLSRRSRVQMLAWDWEGDPADALGHLTVFGVRDDDQPVPA